MLNISPIYTIICQSTLIMSTCWCRFLYWTVIYIWWSCNVNAYWHFCGHAIVIYTFKKIVATFCEYNPYQLHLLANQMTDDCFLPMRSEFFAYPAWCRSALPGRHLQCLRYKAVVITSLVVEQHCLVYKIYIAKCLNFTTDFNRRLARCRVTHEKVQVNCLK